MYKWNFSVVTLEKGRICYSVKASDKQKAIEKGFAQLEKKNLYYGGKFDCTLVRT